MMNNLPDNWFETNLGEIADWGSGGTPKSTEPKYYNGDIPWLIIGDLNDAEITSSKKSITKLGLENSSARIVKVDSILCAMYGSIGKLGIAKIPCATNQAIAFTENIYGRIPYKYLYYYLFSLKKHLLEIGKGGAQQNISQSVLKSVSIPLPPLPEQHRIVSKLDSLMEKIEKNKQRLDKIPTLLKRFRQSVLSAAINGNLTEDFRKKNKLLNSWKLIKAGDICNFITKGTTPKEYEFDKLGGIPFLKVYNIVNQKINFDYKPQFVSIKTHLGQLNRSKVFPGDVIMNIVGPPLGKVAIISNQFPEWNLNQALAIFRPNEKIISEYIYIILSEGTPINKIEREYRGIAGQSNISLEQCRNFDFHIPSILEQKEIVRQVEQLFAFADKIESRYTKAKEMLDKLPQSILAKAFRGELVPQDEKDEPASVLLERIKTEKAKLLLQKKTKTSKSSSQKESLYNKVAEKPAKYKSRK